MAKHEKHDTKFAWEPPKDDFYKARINTLERENLALHEKIVDLEKEIGRLELIIDHDEEINSGISAECKVLLAEKDDEIIILKGKISMLEKAIVNGALREVLA